MSAHFSARIYGSVNGRAPFQDTGGHSAFSLDHPFPAPPVASFPVAGVTVWSLPNGYQMPSGSYVYSVIEVHPTGLNLHGAKYLCDQSGAALATAIA